MAIKWRALRSSREQRDSWRDAVGELTQAFSSSATRPNSGTSTRLALTCVRSREPGWSSTGFFEKGGFNLSGDALYFEPTRDDKIERIARLGCTHFIDDLEEVLEHSRFPAGVRRILFLNGRSDIPAVSYEVCADWQEIEETVFANA